MPSWWATTMDWFQNVLFINPELVRKLTMTIFVVLAVFLIRWLVLRLVFRRQEDIRVRYRWKKSSLYLAVFFLLLVLGRTWISGFQSVTTYLGLLSAGVAIALRDPLVNLVGWVFILSRRPFQTGDRIQIGTITGDVIDIRIFQFTLLEVGNWVDADQSSGRLIHVNNGTVFTQSVANYTQDFPYIWDEIPILITFESDWRKAKELLTEIVTRETASLTQDAQGRLKRAARKFMIIYRTLTPTVYTAVQDSGIQLTLRYLCDPRRRRAIREQIWEAVLNAFDSRSDMDFAYPTIRTYVNRLEGKPGTGGPAR